MFESHQQCQTNGPLDIKRVYRRKGKKSIIRGEMSLIRIETQTLRVTFTTLGSLLYL